MSTKTTFKRVALVAVAALGLGVISVAPSQAAVSSYSLSVDANDTTTVGDSATAVLTQSYFTSATADTAAVTAIIRSGSTAVTKLALAVTDSATSASTVAGAAPTSFTNGGATPVTGVLLQAATATTIHSAKAGQGVVATNKYAVLLYNIAVAGTYYVDFYSTDGTGAATSANSLVTWTVTVKAASAADSTSTAFIHAGSSPAVTDSTTITAEKTANTLAANIKVTQNTAGAATSASALESLTAVITGVGTINANATAGAGSGAGRSLTVKHSDYINVFADGTTGTGTITVTGATSGTVYKTATITFYSSTPKTVTATVAKAYPAAGKTTTKAVNVSVKDATGNVVSNAGVTLEPTTVGTGETTTAANCVYSSLISAYSCSLTGTSASKFGKVTYKAHVTGADTDATEIYSTAFDVTFADIVATSVVLSAPSTGAVGDKVTVTLTAKEKNGYPVADSTYEGGTATTVGGIFWNTTTVPVYSSSNFKPFNTSETITTTSGVATVDLYLPAVAGNVTATWTLAGTAGAGISTGAIDKSISGSTAAITIAVANPGVDAATDAANEATDAANAATDAALSATVAKLVASLKAQITSLTNLVIKIQKKVRA
jgi:hypothetical protein